MLVPGLDEAVSVKLKYVPSRDFLLAISTEGSVNVPED
jgi:hypothetical protein